MVSIIIPVLNEEKTLPRLLSYLKKCPSIGEHEIVIVDGGSTDGTIDVINSEGIEVSQSPKGRAKQMNAGAKIAKGDILYFLHADTYPPGNFIEEILAVTQIGYSAGCFRLKFDSESIFLNFYSWFTRFNIDSFRFGDQSLFVSKSVFEDIGGFNEELIVMEDQEIVRKIKSVARFKVLENNVITSSRKYDEVGVLKLQYIFTVIFLMYYLGFSQDNMVRFYKRSVESVNVTLV